MTYFCHGCVMVYSLFFLSRLFFFIVTCGCGLVCGFCGFCSGFCSGFVVFAVVFVVWFCGFVDVLVVVVV